MPRQKILIAFALALFVFAAACGRLNESRTGLDSRLRKLVPGDTTSLAEARVDQLQKSSFYLRVRDKYHLGTPTFPAVGFDPSRDLHTMLLCWDGRVFSLAAEGQFRKTVIETFLAARYHEQSFDGITLFQLGQQTLTLPDDKLAFAAPGIGEVKQAIERLRASGSQFPVELQTSLAWLPAAAQIRIASRGGLPFADIPMRSDYASILANFRGYVRTSALGIAFDQDVHLRGRVECVSPEGSKRIYDALRAAVGMGRLSVKNGDRDLLGAYDALKISRQSSTVSLQADLPGDRAESLLAHLTQLRH